MAYEKEIAAIAALEAAQLALEEARAVALAAGQAAFALDEEYRAFLRTFRRIPRGSERNAAYAAAAQQLDAYAAQERYLRAAEEAAWAAFRAVHVPDLEGRFWSPVTRGD